MSFRVIVIVFSLRLFTSPAHTSMFISVRQNRLGFLLLVLVIAGPISCQYNCTKEAAKCSDKGVCDKNGYCVCNIGFLGDNCSTPSSKPFAEPGLSKSFLVFWILFWIILNCLLPYVIYLLVVYLKEKNCDKLKDHFTNFKEAFCCCFISQPTYRSSSSLLPAQDVKLVAADDQQKKGLLELNAVSKVEPKPKTYPKPTNDLAKFSALQGSPSADLELLSRARVDMSKLGYTPVCPQFQPKFEVAPLSKEEVKTYQSELKSLKEQLEKEAPTQGTSLEAVQEALFQSMAAGLKSPAEP